MKSFFKKAAGFVSGNLSTMLLAAALLLQLLSAFSRDSFRDLESAAQSVACGLEDMERRMDRAAEKVLSMPQAEWPFLKGAGEDLVIYKYVNDTLHSWINRFPLRNDEIHSLQYNRLSRTQTIFLPVLSDVTPRASYMNIGSDWYMVKSYSRGNVKLVAGIFIKYGESYKDLSLSDGVNGRLGLPSNCGIEPLPMSDGRVVATRDGTPFFSVVYGDLDKIVRGHDNSVLKWAALLFFLLSFFTYYVRKKNLVTFAFLTASLAAAVVASFRWAASAGPFSGIFSPLIYADSSLFPSLGMLLLNNFFLFFFTLSLFMARKRLMLWYGKSSWLSRTMYAVAVGLMAVLLLVYIHVSLRSVIYNSNIVLEVFRLDELSWNTLFVYLSYLMLFLAFLFLLQLFTPVLPGKRFQVFSVSSLMKFSAAVALYFLATVSICGSRKEVDTVKVWVNKLAVERDLSTEMLLRTVEEGVAQDRIIRTLAGLEGAGQLVADRLAENYLARLSTGYDIIVTVCGEGDYIYINTGSNGRSYVNCTDYYRKMVRGAAPLHPGSHFYFVKDNSGKTKYLGSFLYKGADGSSKYLFVTIESKMFKQQRGYSGLFSDDFGRGYNIPPAYSYAKYVSGALVFFRGNYNFPVSVDGNFLKSYPLGFTSRNIGDNVVFAEKLSDTDIIFVTRQHRTVWPYVISFSYIFFLTVLIIVAPFVWRPGRKSDVMRSKSFRAKFLGLLVGTIVGTVVLLSISTVVFITNRNVKMRNDQMSDKLQSVHAMLQDVCRNVSSMDGLISADIKTALDNIASYTHTDINLYDVQGHLRLSTRNELGLVTLAGAKIDADAYYSIVYKNRKNFIGSESIGGQMFFSIYAPVLNKNGDMIAILNIPYFEQVEDFRREIISTSAAIVNLFVLLVIVVVAIGAAITKSLFRPLSDLYERMEKTDIFNSAGRIEYNNNDEISYIVGAYNRMLDNLSDSTRKLALTEREQAWRDMARQIAHEIKNPLTPMRLSIQHLMRMKQNGDPDLEDKMERICRSLLEQIDVLADTATEFSSFAKFNVEENVQMDMVQVIREQLTLFRSYEGIDIEFRIAGEMVGETYVVMAPKSQIIRVFVNLITNAVQALDPNVLSRVGRGHIVITISKYTASADSGMGTEGVRYVRVDVEDNGPGVSKENEVKLFTPKFTTKSSGTGLGLAICRSVVEQVGGSIKYYTSDEFGGADFRVIIPEYREHGLISALGRSGQDSR